MYSFNVEMNHSPKLSPSTSDSSIGSPSSPAASPRRVNGSSDKTMTMAELQQENARLRKELEAKETKLNSSMRSIKMFWSPELKKERAARKAEEEKHARLREQFSVVSKESQVGIVDNCKFLLWWMFYGLITMKWRKRRLPFWVEKSSEAVEFVSGL